MKALIFTSILILGMAGNILAQEGYYSQDNATHNWEDNATWTKSQSWLGNNPGNNVGGATAYIQLYGRVTRNGDLQISGGSTINLYDTLLINGNLTLSGSGKMKVQSGGVLIVTGDYKGSGGTGITNAGRVVITGSFALSGSSSVNNSQDFYVYSTPTRSGGAKFNNSNNYTASNIGTESDLAADDPGLYALTLGKTLPVEFLYVRAEGGNGNVAIRWATASEKNNDYFTVQRSVDGKEYVELARVEGAGTITGKTEYAYTDNQPVFGSAYYRIQQTDDNGDTAYSPIAKSTTTAQQTSESFSVYPNPSQGQFRLDLRSTGSELVTITVFNDHGSAVYQSTMQGGLSANDPIDLMAMSRGIYIVEVKSSLNVLRQRVVLN